MFLGLLILIRVDLENRKDLLSKVPTCEYSLSTFLGKSYMQSTTTPFMDRILSIIIFAAILSSLLVMPLSTNLVVAQSSITIENGVPPNEVAAPLLEKIQGASSLSNIQTISWVNGIEVTGVNIGESDATITLRQVQDPGANKSLPVTVTVVKTPGSSIKNLIALIDASNKLTGKNTTNPLIGMIGKLGQSSPSPNASVPAGPVPSPSGNTSESFRPLMALLQLGQGTRMGIGNVVGGDWEKPRTVTTGLATLGELTGLGGSESAPEERASFVMVFVAPYSGKTSIGSVELN